MKGDPPEKQSVFSNMPDDFGYMRRALELAVRGRGRVEPNPMVGCVLVRDDRIVGEGWHRCFGGGHAEVHALAQAGCAAVGATCYVTLEPCSHHGKTPPCTDALLAAGVGRVVVAMQDPYPEVRGRGIARLRQHHVEVEVGVGEDQARSLNAPYLCRLEKKRPWVLAKWAMTLDGKIASATHSSRWVSSPSSRQRVHELRSCMDAILIGIRTAEYDDPMLTVRADNPPGTHVPLRIVLDTTARLSPSSRLVASARDVPLLIAVGPDAPAAQIDALRDAGCEIFTFPSPLGTAARSESASPHIRERFDALFAELARRNCTNLLVEGGSLVLGSLFDLRLIDEVHTFITPKLIGGAGAPSPISGIGLGDMANAYRLVDPQIRLIESDLYVSGRIRYDADERASQGAAT